MQVASLQAEVAMVQSQVMNSRFAMANALQNSHHQQQQLQQAAPPQQHHVAVLQPAYSNSSSASTNFINNITTSFPSNFDLSSHSMELLHQMSQPAQDDEDDEEDSRIPLDFANQILHRRS